MQLPAKERKAKAKLSSTDTQQTADLPSKEAQKEMLSTEDLTEHVSVPVRKLELRRRESRSSSGLFSVYLPPSVADKCRKFIENIEKGIVLCPSPLDSPSPSLTPLYWENMMKMKMKAMKAMKTINTVKVMEMTITRIAVPHFRQLYK